ncbi:hypothetical protein K438DRAFT_1976468 [Mycena galopus ATCC 62051]|nr:hypothetical protein K438DRAFT_1976468 [Mycena galopus ATCC 62051]
MSNACDYSAPSTHLPPTLELHQKVCANWGERTIFGVQVVHVASCAVISRKIPFLLSSQSAASPLPPYGKRFHLRPHNIPGSSSTRARIQDSVPYPYAYEITNPHWFNLGSHRRQLNTNDAVHNTTRDLIHFTAFATRRAVQHARAVRKLSIQLHGTSTSRIATLEIEILALPRGHRCVGATTRQGRISVMDASPRLQSPTYPRITDISTEVLKAQRTECVLIAWPRYSTPLHS